MMLEAALKWASKGFAVFPLQPLGKEPLAGSNGHQDATTNADAIRAMWTKTPDANIGVSPAHSGMFVLDQDGPRGAETIATLEMEHGLLPATLTFQTPRGPSHLHRWYRGKCGTSVGRQNKDGRIVGLGPKLDTRGYGGYVLLPPSRVVDPAKGIDGIYQCTDEREIEHGPRWVAEVLAQNREGAKSTSDVELDLPVNIERARALLRGYVERGDVAIEGSGGDNRTYQLACEVLSLGLSSACAAELVWRIWNPACEPPWDKDELGAKIANAAEYMQNDVGAWAVKPDEQTFASFSGPTGDVDTARSDEPNSKRSRFYPHYITDVAAFRPPNWLIPDLIPERGTVQITGPRKSFKTFLALDMALGIAAGVETFGHVPAAAPVVYVAGENASTLALSHVPAWCLANSQEISLLPFRVVQTMPRARLQEEFLEMVAQIKAEQINPCLLVIDTATRALRGLDENSAKDMGLLAEACEMVQRELDCTVLVIRHTGKDVERGSRGSNVLEGDFDTVLTVERVDKTKICKLVVSEQRNAQERELPYTFEAVPFAGSLVMKPISEKSYMEQAKKDDLYDRTRIGAVLVRLNATSEDRSLETFVLAAELCPPSSSQSPEERDKTIRRVAKQLDIRARTTLAGFAFGDGKHSRWAALPAD
jgi:AAA domain/Bifunctional DNA primase/polymerase, N-terminal